MQKIDVIDKLAGIARQEPTPFVNVTVSVMQKLRMQDEAVISFWGIAAIAVVTIASFILFSQICLVSQDPLIELFESIRSILL